MTVCHTSTGTCASGENFEMWNLSGFLPAAQVQVTQDKGDEVGARMDSSTSAVNWKGWKEKETGPNRAGTRESSVFPLFLLLPACTPMEAPVDQTM